MREIKFRAWNECEKIMEYDIQEEYDGDLSCFGCYLNNEFWEVMQYTGLKDRAGKEIYEGDIIKYQRMGTTELLVVGWCKDYASFMFGHIKVEFALRYGEVIGNIYENPELLEEK